MDIIFHFYIDYIFVYIYFLKKQKDSTFITKNLNDLCASLQYSLVQIILNKIQKAAKDYNIKQVVIGGGVAANSEIRIQLKNKAKSEGWEVFLPPQHLTTDNAAMIGIASYFKIQKNKYGNISDSSMSRLKI